MRQKPLKGSLMLTLEVEEIVEGLEIEGCVVKRDKDAGTIDVTDPQDGDKFAFRAIQKGPKQPWIGMFFATSRISWFDHEGGYIG